MHIDIVDFLGVNYTRDAIIVDISVTPTIAALHDHHSILY